MSVPRFYTTELITKKQLLTLIGIAEKCGTKPHPFNRIANKRRFRIDINLKMYQVKRGVDFQEVVKSFDEMRACLEIEKINAIVEGYTNENCPLCEVDVCNGMGPATSPMLTDILEKFPMAKVFYRECCMHDMDFHLQRGFKLSNKNFLTRMRAKALTLKFEGKWYVRYAKRKVYRLLPYAIKWFVSGKMGREAYAAGACKLVEK